MTLVNFNATTPQLALVKNFMNAYLTLDVKKISPFISKNFTFQTFPKTPDLPDQAKGEHFEGYETLLSMISKAEVIVHEVIEAPGKVVLHVSSVSYIVDGSRLDYDSLTILTIIEEDGELKILDSKDFSDPQKREKLHNLVANAQGKGRLVA